MAGCGEFDPPVHSAAVRAEVTKADPALATADHWWNQPPTAHAAGGRDFQRVWDACLAELNARLFLVDREEYRPGLLTTAPMISKQVFEPWRTDAVTWPDVGQSTLGTVRRTVRVEVARGPDGSYTATPKVLVERYASVERRLTAISQYHQAFSGPREFADAPDLSGDAAVKDAVADYWYPLHRDADLEREMASSISARLAGRG